MLTLKSMHIVNPITLKLMYHHISNNIKSEINVYTEINASNASNQIILENNFYTKINAFNANNQIALEIIYIEINASRASNQISLEINIYTKINASSESNQIGLEITIYAKINTSILVKNQNIHEFLNLTSRYLFFYVRLFLLPSLSTFHFVSISLPLSFFLSPSLSPLSLSLSLTFSIFLFFPLSPFHLYLCLPPSLLICLSFLVP